MNQTYYKQKEQIQRIIKELLKYEIKTDCITYNVESENELFAKAGIECVKAIKAILNIKDEN